MKARTCTVPVACLTAAALLSGCGDKSSASTSTTDVVRPLPAWVVREAPAEVTRSFPGVVTASDSVALSFQVGGRLTDLPVLEAQELRQGDLIACLDKRDFENRVYAARARVDAVDRKLERLKIAYERQAVSEMELIEHQAVRDAAVAQLNIDLKALEDTEIRAPYDGVVTSKLVDPFTDVAAGDGVVTFGAIEDIKIVISLPEHDVIHASEDNPGRFMATFAALPGREFPLVYRESNAQADHVTQTYEVTFTMPAPDGVNVLPGMTAEVTWTRDIPGRDPGLLIPAAAAFSTPGGDSAVWHIDRGSGVIARRAIQIGAVDADGMITVIDGLRPGELVSAAGINHLRDGMTVRPVLGERGKHHGVVVAERKP